MKLAKPLFEFILIRPIVIFFLFIASAFIVGAFFAYPFHFFINSFIELPFRKSLNYGTLICGLVLSFAYLYYYRLLSFKALGYSDSHKIFIRKFSLNLAGGLALMFGLEIIFLILGIHEIDQTRATIISLLPTIAKYLFIALIIAVVEETLFRGALYGGLKSQTNILIAAILSSFFYAITHFTKYPEVTTTPELFTGIQLLPQAVSAIFNWQLFDSVLVLFLLGLILVNLKEKTHSLASSIGFHAGIVLGMKLIRHYTNTTEVNYTFIRGSQSDMMGYLTALSLILILFWLNKDKFLK